MVLVKRAQVKESSHSVQKFYRKDAMPIEVKRDVAFRIKERQMLDSMSKAERFLWSGAFISVWDGIMCICGINMIILLPISAFDKIEGNMFWVPFNIITELLFIIDMAILFNRPFLYKNKWMIGKEKFRKRFKTWTLYLDIIALFPQFTVLYFTPIYNDPDYKWIRYIYVVKLLKSHHFFSYLDFIIKKLNYNSDSEMSRVFKLFIYLLVIIQIIGCLWIKFALDSPDPGNWITNHGFQDNEYMQIYFSAVYFATVTTTTIGYGDFAGTIHQEVAFIVICIIIGSIYYSFFISIVSSIFSNRALREHTYSTYLRYIRYMKKKYGVPQDLCLKLKLHYENQTRNMVLSARDKRYDFYELLNGFPPTIQYDVRMHVNAYAIETVEFLQDRDPEFYVQFLPICLQQKFLKQAFLFKEGQIATFVIILVKGKALNMLTKSIITEGTMLGEGDIVKFRKRQENIIAVEECECIQIERFSFLDFLKQFPEIEKEVQAQVEEKDKILQPFLDERKRQRAEEKKGGKIRKKVKASKINKKIRDRLINIQAFKADGMSSRKNMILGKKNPEMAKGSSTNFPKIATFWASKAKGKNVNSKKRSLIKSIRRGSVLQSQSSLASVEAMKKSSHKIVQLAKQSTMRVMAMTKTMNALTRQNSTNRNTVQPSPDALVFRKNSELPARQETIGLQSNQTDRSGTNKLRKSTFHRSQKNSEYEGGSISEESSESAKSVSTPSETVERPAHALKAKKVSDTASYLKNLDLGPDSKSVSSKESNLHHANSSSLTISQDQDQATLGCIRRIMALTKEIKAKFTKGRDVATAFLDLITEVEKQTKRYNGDKGKQIIYSYCYENMKSAFENYAKLMKLCKAGMPEMQVLEKVKYTVQLYGEVNSCMRLFTETEGEHTHNTNKTESKSMTPKSNNESVPAQTTDFNRILSKPHTLVEEEKVPEPNMISQPSLGMQPSVVPEPVAQNKDVLFIENMDSFSESSSPEDFEF